MPRLPEPDGDAGRWGTILNEFLEVEHNPDGTLKDTARQADLATLGSNLQDLEQDVHNNTLSIGTVDTGSPAASITGTVPNQTLNLTLPDGNLPGGGTSGQVITAVPNGLPTWQDIPGIVYPSLLLSPDGSFDRDGVVVPTVGGGATVVAGQYGNAWQGGTLSVPNGRLGEVFTVLIRVFRTTNAYFFNSNNGTGILLGGDDWVFLGGGSSYRGSATPNMNKWVTWAVAFDGTTARFRRDTSEPLVTSGSMGIPNYGSAALNINGQTRESVLIYPVALPNSEIDRISTLPTAWTMQNAAANIYQPSSQFNLFVPSKKTASGSTTLRNAPGTGSDTIATLSANTLIEVSQAVRNVSSVDYALVKIQTGETGWVPVGQITDL